MAVASPETRTSQAAKLWYLKRFPLFAGFTPDELYDVQRATEVVSYRKGESLYLPGEPGTRLFMLKAGVVKITRVLADGRELTLALLKPGDLFGELEVVGDQTYEAQAVAYGNVLLCVMRKTDVLRWARRSHRERLVGWDA